eukprot:16429141-Heterocapsa_arctica.AAC.2
MPIDLTEEPHVNSQETEEGAPLHHQGGNQGNPASGPDPTNTEHNGSGSLEEERSLHPNHKGSQTGIEPDFGATLEGVPWTQAAADQLWLEGYEAARRVMRQYFHELHQAQADRGESGWIWKRLSEEMLEMAEARDSSGQQAGAGTAEGTEMASGSTDNQNGAGPPRDTDRAPGRMVHRTASNHPEEGESRKRSRSTEQEEPQEPVPMDVDQEGEGGQQPEDDHGTEQEDLDFAEQHHYANAPSGGWNHEGSELRETKEVSTINREATFDIRVDMLKLALRI